MKTEKFPLFTASIYISALEISFLFFLILTFNAIFYPERLVAKDFIELIGLTQNSGKILAVILCILLQLINYFFYKSKISELEELYKTNHSKSRFKIWMFYFIGFLFFAVPILIFKFRN